MSMCKLHPEFYRQQAKLDALLTRRCHTITEGKNGEGATYIKTAAKYMVLLTVITVSFVTVLMLVL